jgi:polyisoprenoid-binding protein YceI
MKMFSLLALAVLATAAAPAANSLQNIDSQHSKLTVYVYKKGLFSFLADNHVIDAPITRGSYDAQRKTIDVVVDAANMRVLDPKLPADKRSSVQSNMTGPQVLDVAKYPTITLRSTQFDSRGNGPWTVAGDLSLHGQTHPIQLQVQSAGSDRFTGSAMIRQTTFGITPIKIAGGAVSVADDVRVEFQIALTSASMP